VEEGREMRTKVRREYEEDLIAFDFEFCIFILSSESGIWQDFGAGKGNNYFRAEFLC
jgi:hypothetical protein